jgi:hypothetical protein
MLGRFSKLLPMGLLLFATFSSSPHYGLNNYSVGPGATDGGTAGSYTVQGNLGEQANQSTSAGSDTASGGAVKTEQLNLPLAPTLSNGSGTYYNKLQVTINQGILPSDTTYAMAISTISCTNTNYVESAGILGSSAYYQSYTAWGGSSGSYIVGLAPSTTYYVRVAAKEGLYTNTEFGSCATASTVSPSISFSLSTNTVALGNLNAGSVITSASPVTFNITTNAASGGNIYVAGKSGGLYSVRTNYTIAAASTNLATAAQGFGLQGASASESSGGPLTISSPYNGTADNVGTESTTFATLFTSANPITTGVGTLNFLAKAANTDPASQDYQEVLTFVASASF